MTFDDLFATHVMVGHRRQVRFLESLGEAVRWELDTQAGLLVLEGHSTQPIQVLGLETPNADWRWAWDDNGYLPTDLAAASRRVLEFGADAGIPMLTTGQNNLTDLRGTGHQLALVASAILGEHPYWRAEQPDGVAVFLHLPNVVLSNDLPTLDRDTVLQELFSAYVAYGMPHDEISWSNGLRAAGFDVKVDPTGIVGIRGEEAPIDVRW